MQDELKSVLIDVIMTSKDLLRECFLFAKQEIPDVISQLLLYNMTISLVGFIVGLLGVLASCFSIYKGYRRSVDTIDDGFAFLLSFGGFCAALFSGIFMACNLEWIKIALAPKLFLIEFAAKLVK